MITIFAIPKPFVDPHIKIIQRNAIKSWLALHHGIEIILMGKEEGLAEAAQEFKTRHIEALERNRFGTPLWSSAFQIARKEAKNDTLCYIESDNLLTSDFIKAVAGVNKPLYLMAGQRTDLDVKEIIDFNDCRWEERIRRQVRENGNLHGAGAMDYFVFPKKLQFELPPFPVGRPLHDNWFIYKVKSMKIPVIDATQAILDIHQNHSYSHHPEGKKGVWEGEEARENLKMAGGYKFAFNLYAADFCLTKDGLKKPKITIAYLREYFRSLTVLNPKLGFWPRIIGSILDPKRTAGLLLRKLKIIK